MATSTAAVTATTYIIRNYFFKTVTILFTVIISRRSKTSTRSSAVAVIADRTACSILTLFIVSTTSRPLNKKSVCCQSANPINNYCGSASANSQSAHLSARALQSAVSAHASAVAPNGTVPTRSPRNAITVYWDLGALRHPVISVCVCLSVCPSVCL